MNTKYTVIGLEPGYKYYFKVSCENEYGFSLDSEVFGIVSAWKPFPPSVLSTTNVNSKINMNWDTPRDSGADVTGYKLYIKTFSSQYV